MTLVSLIDVEHSVFIFAGSADGVECIRMRWWSLAIIITSVIVVL
jgi:hypothetical protein